MAKYKAIVVTSHAGAYENFIKDNNLNRDDYVYVNDRMSLYGYKNTIAFLVFGWQNVFGEDIDFNHTEAVLRNHNVDMIK